MKKNVVEYNYLKEFLADHGYYLTDDLFFPDSNALFDVNEYIQYVEPRLNSRKKVAFVYKKNYDNIGNDGVVFIECDSNTLNIYKNKDSLFNEFKLLNENITANWTRFLEEKNTQKR